jgi:hypothetical protein
VKPPPPPDLAPHEMDSIRQYWIETMELPGANWVVSIFGLVSSLLIAFYVVKWFRDLAIGVGNEPISHLTEFERLYSAGTIDEDEFKQLKKTLPQNMKSEMAARMAKFNSPSLELNPAPNKTDFATVQETPESTEPTFTEIEDRTDQSNSQ